MFEYIFISIAFTTTVYCLYTHNVSVRKHIKENKEMHDLIKEIHHIVKNN